MKPLIIGIGNPLKTDDNIGNIISRELSKEYEVVIAETNPESYLGKMKEHDTIIFVDAVDFNARPGEVKLFSLEEVRDKKFSTHSVPLGMVRSFFPGKKVFVIGIMPKSIDYGSSITREMKAMKKKVIKKTKQLLDEVLS